MLIFFEVFRKLSVSADTTVMTVFPVFLAVTFPAAVTSATAVFEDEYVTFPFAPVTEIDAFLPTVTVEALVFAESDCDALEIVKYFLI